MLSRSPNARRKLNPRLIQVITISFILHLVVGLVLGGITIVEYVIQDEADFEAPEVLEVEEPPKELKVEIKPKVQKMEAQQLSLKTVSNIAVDAIDVDLPNMTDSFTVSSGIGSGGSLNLGAGTGGMVSKFPDIKGFGTSKKTEFAWEGTVYLFDEKKISSLRDKQGKWFTKYQGDRRGDRQSARIYNYSFNVPSQDFTKGFPGVTDQFEWFAIDFELKLHWPQELVGEYEFKLESDDGSILVIDNDIVIDNDGQHAMTTATGTHKMKFGRRKFRLAYFQGPATRVGLMLHYRKAGESQWKLFDAKELIKYQL